MKPSFTLLGAVLCLTWTANAQNTKSLNTKEYSSGINNYKPLSGNHQTGNQTIYFSEDFSNGIPSNWTNQGFDFNLNPIAPAIFEYRGSNTNPDVNIGSRDYYSTIHYDGAPIESPTANNGFVIFDSGYLDNLGLANNDQNGSAPSPHVGSLTTDTLDFTSVSHLELKFNSHFKFWGTHLYVTFSTDAGLSYPDTIHFQEGLSQTFRTNPKSEVVMNVSSIIGNKDNVRIRFVFDGRYDETGNLNSDGLKTGAFFWMLDDIELRRLPDYAIGIVKEHGHSEIKMAYNGDTDWPLGNRFTVTNGTNQTRKLSFGIGAINQGKNTLHNVKLKVDYLDNSNNILFTEFSAATSSLLPGASIQ
ncbi:MAG: hypothetical protein N4A46_01895, partial [Schleiferiaceae bacterium]|nr:hypothetical protein [Schleiferiaceae bacterium]